MKLFKAMQNSFIGFLLQMKNLECKNNQKQMKVTLNQVFISLLLLVALCKCQDITQFRTLQLQRHNLKRALHENTPPLQLNDTLNNEAQQYAEYLAANELFEHSSSGYGQNLYVASRCCETQTYQQDLFSATGSWYDEIQLYNYSNPGFSSGTGHFTQVVWKDSTDVGFGIAKMVNATGWTKWYVVANYNPPGNYNNNFVANVLPLKNTNTNPSPSPQPQPTPLPTPETQPQYIIQFRNEQLAKHNQYRGQHNASSLALDGNLNDLAQQCAQKWRDGISCTGSYGKNYYRIFSSSQAYNYTLHTPTWASKAWYNQKQSYNQASPAGSAFTRMIWKSTTIVGFGLTNKFQNGQQNWYIVAYYDPAGNRQGQYAANVDV